LACARALEDKVVAALPAVWSRAEAASGSRGGAVPVNAGNPINSYNEWDPLEEVIVGRLDGATIPSGHISVISNLPPFAARVCRLTAGFRYPKWMIRLAQQELDSFIHILESEGIRVRRPDIIEFRRRYRVPQWSSRGFSTACPRDILLVIGNEIIETPSCWRSRYFETRAYRSLLKEYFAKGARWTAAPKPELTDKLFDCSYRVPNPKEPMRFVVNEFEPVFDAADFVRCGRDLFVTRSNVTNEIGIEWLRRHLGSEFRIHELESRSRQPMHIDSTFMPLAPGKVLVNPQYLDVERLPTILKTWDVLVAPQPDPVQGIMTRISMCSPWTSINVLMLDEQRVVVDNSQVTLIKALKNWGFIPIPCAFLSYGPFGGSFHCAALDVRRRGNLQSYF
jgi:glycine amidinotransferase